MFSELNLPARKNPVFESIYDLEFKKELGKGAFSVVYEAYYRPTNSKYAVKKLSKSKLTPHDKMNIEHELQIHSTIDHKHIVKFVDYLVEEKAIFIILEICSEGNLFQYIKNNAITSDQIKKIFYQSACVLSYLHENRIILRDLKPENILIDENLNIKICDFGWACYMNDSSYSSSIAGTYCYMPPEALKSEKQDEKSDMWSLGILLYELTYNKEPFFGITPSEMLQKIYCQRIKFDELTDGDVIELISSLLQIDSTKRLSLSMVFESKFLKKYYKLIPKSKLLHLENKINHKDPSKFQINTKTSLRPVEVIAKKQNEEKNVKKILNLNGIETGKVNNDQNMKAISSKENHLFNDFIEKYGTNKKQTNESINKSLIERIHSKDFSKSRILEENSIIKKNFQNSRFCNTQKVNSFKPQTQKIQENVYLKHHLNECSILKFGLNEKTNFSNQTDQEGNSLFLLKRGMSPNVIASTLNSNIEINFGSNSASISGISNKSKMPSNRDFAINRKIIFAPNENMSLMKNTTFQTEQQLLKNKNISKNGQCEKGSILNISEQFQLSGTALREFSKKIENNGLAKWSENQDEKVSNNKMNLENLKPKISGSENGISFSALIQKMKTNGK